MAWRAAVCSTGGGYGGCRARGCLPSPAPLAGQPGKVGVVSAPAPVYGTPGGRPRAPADLADHDCLRYAYLATANEWRFRGPSGPLAVRIDGPLVANNGDVLKDAAVAGLGVALLPTFLAATEIGIGRLAAVLAGYEPEPVGDGKSVVQGKRVAV